MEAILDKTGFFWKVILMGKTNNQKVEIDKLGKNDQKENTIKIIIFMDSFIIMLKKTR